MNDDTPRAAPVRSGIDYRFAIVCFVILAVILFLAFVVPFGSQSGSRTVESGTFAMDAPDDTEEATRAMAHAEARAVTERMLLAAESKVEYIRALLDDADRQFNEWSALQETMLTGDLGRRIAANETLTEQFIALHDNRNPDRTQQQLAKLREQLDALAAAVVDMRGAASGTHKPDALLKDLDAVMGDARQSALRMQAHARALTALGVAARAETLSELTLQEAMMLIGGRAAQRHASEIKRIVDEGAQRRYANIQDIEREKQRRSDIASSQTARQLLWFMTEDGKTIEPICGKAYDDYQFFTEIFTLAVSRRRGLGSVIFSHSTIQDEWRVVNSQSETAFGLTLHDLYRVFMLSQQNRNHFVLSIDQTQQIAMGTTRDSLVSQANAARWLKDGRALPPPSLP